MKQTFSVITILVLVTAVITFLFTFNQVNLEKQRLESDIQRRASLVTDTLKETVEPNFINKSETNLQPLVEKFADNQRIVALAIADNKGRIVASSKGMPTEMAEFMKLESDAMDGDRQAGSFLNFGSERLYIFASPIHNKKIVVGALIIAQNAEYIDSRIDEIWKNNLLRFIAQSFLISLAVVFLLKWILFEPIGSLVKSLELIRSGNKYNKPHRVFDNPIFRPLIQEFGNLQQNLIAARIAASEEARLRLKKIDSPWTADRLSAFVQDLLKGRSIFVVSNREPYVHTRVGNRNEYYVPASGMVTAISAIMEATGGTWIAQGTGNADRLVVDQDDKIGVPPNDPKYILKRVWLSDEEKKGFYDGFSNEGLWPLCHLAHIRPVFVKKDWEEYRRVNEKFAKALLKEIKDHQNPIVLIQDFHFALLPRIIKEARPDAVIALFWHIPWPNAESFSICPWKKELLDGMLGVDILGFHTQLHCNNFINTVGKELEALVDLEQFSITKGGHFTAIKPFPISIAFTKSQQGSKKVKNEIAQNMLKKLGIDSKYIGIGVDRLDYTKGLLERLKGIELFLTMYPQYVEKFTFIQIAAPSRSSIKEYQEFDARVSEEINRINNKFKQEEWKPIIYLKKYHSHADIYPLYRAADVCMVTSLHDGMNLVAKEFVSARDDEKGVLVLSQFAGAARELRDALIINPYSGEQTANSIYTALRMKREEQTRRMRRMRDIVGGYNIYRWSAELLKAMADLG